MRYKTLQKKNPTSDVPWICIIDHYDHSAYDLATCPVPELFTLGVTMEILQEMNPLIDFSEIELVEVEINVI